MGERTPRKRVLVIVEGVSDQAFIQVLLKKTTDTWARVLRMNGYRPDRVAKIINAYQHKVDLIIVLLDQHCNPQDKVIDMANRIRNKVSGEARRKLYTITVTKAVEAWILADQEALKNICSKASFTENPENPHNPAEVLRRELMKCGKTYIKTRRWGKYLGEKVDPERIACRSKSFKQFYEILKDP